MGSYGFPLVAWGTVEDISGASWNTSGGPTLTNGQTDPFGGTGAVLVNDTSATLTQFAYRNFTITVAGTQWFGLWVKAGSATASEIRWTDLGTGVLALYKLTWSGGVPTAAITLGSGSIVGPVSAGNGWYLFLLGANNAVTVTANQQRISLYGATSTVTDVGSTYYFWQSAVLLDALDEMLPWAPPRDGSDWVRSDAGTPDAWLTGQDYHLKCIVCDIPAAPQSFPSIVSGWDGNAEIPCVNHGVERMLYVGAQKQTLRFVPDRSNCLTYWDSELVAPLQEVPILQRNGWRRFDMELRNITKRYPGIA